MPQTDRVTELGIDIAALQGVSSDSRTAGKGCLFAALKGEKVDGREYIDDAIKNGVSVILTDADYNVPEGVQLVISDNPGRDLSHIAASFYAPLPEHIVAVTGTNGKSSVVHFAAQLWQKQAIKGVMMGTLTGKLTTPDPVALFETLGRLKQDEGITHVALEASSHGLAQHRVDGAPIKVAAFTNFTQDHLDYHIDMDSYFEAKTRLFEELLPISGTAVLNADVPSYPSLYNVCKRRGIRTISYGEKGEDIKLASRKVVGVTQEITLEAMGQSYDLTIPFVGAFQVMNVLCAFACLIASGSQVKPLIEGISTLEGVPGRLQHVSDPDQTYNAYVDFAHTPDALETVLKALRPHTDGKLICVFGCGGDRDVTKRPKMGEIAVRLADIAIITDDNPRTEEPSSIREQIEVGISAELKQQKDTLNIAGRRAAIGKAVELMHEGDILILAGKGHERGQIIGSEVHPFDDAAELSKALSNKHKTKKQKVE